MKRGKRTSVAKATKAVEEVVETVKIPMAVHITGLQRPWAEEDLKGKLISVSNSEITDFRVNSTKSECIATIADTEGAERIREELHGKAWHSKPGANPISIDIVAPNFEFVTPSVSESSAMDVSTTEIPSSVQLETESTTMVTDAGDKAEASGILFTKTLPSLSFRPRSEEQVAHMRKRRNYELDSTTLNGRFYSEKKRKRRHAQMAADSPSPTAPPPSSSTPSATPAPPSSAPRDHSRDHYHSRRNDRNDHRGGDRGGDRVGDRSSGSYDRRDSRNDHYERRETHSRGGRY
jgi:hypothetical protein